MSNISDEARELLAANYRNHKKPWFAAEVLNPRSKQFNVALEVITQSLTKNHNMFTLIIVGAICGVVGYAIGSGAGL